MSSILQRIKQESQFLGEERVSSRIATLTALTILPKKSPTQQVKKNTAVKLMTACFLLNISTHLTAENIKDNAILKQEITINESLLRLNIKPFSSQAKKNLELLNSAKQEPKITRENFKAQLKELQHLLSEKRETIATPEALNLLSLLEQDQENSTPPTTELKEAKNLLHRSGLSPALNQNQNKQRNSNPEQSLS